MNQKICLKTLLQALSEAATYANETLAGDYSDALRKAESGASLILPPPPLYIAGMTASFTAQVSEADSLRCQQGDTDIVLDFGAQESNFKGKIVIRPYEAELRGLCETPDATAGTVESDTPQDAFRRAPEDQRQAPEE